MRLHPESMFRRASIGRKLSLLPVLAVVALFTVLVVNVVTARATDRADAQIANGHYPWVLLGRQLQATLASTQIELRDAVMSHDTEKLQRADSLRGAYLSALHGASANPVVDGAELERMDHDFGAYFTVARETSRRLIAGEDMGVLMNDIQLMSSRYNGVRTALEESVARGESSIDSAFRNSASARRRAAIFTVGTLIASLVLLGILSILIARALLRPLRGAVGVADRLAQGDVTVRVDGTDGASRDEVEQLRASMGRMVTYLSGVIAELRDGSVAISGASNEVSSAAQRLSRSTSDESAAAQEVAAMLTELGASVSGTAEHSAEMRRMAERGASDASESGQATRDALQAMSSITERISVVEDIAQQTNLLALNAAIEAAHAGERGRGFAVVAAEIRKLAEHSDELAKEINQLAVSGRKIAERAGTLLDQLVPTIRQTAALVDHVAVASAEQAAGVQRIQHAMGQLDELTQGNAAGAEELAATAEELLGRATTLDGIVAFFRTDAAAATRSGALRSDPAATLAAPAAGRTPARRLPRPLPPAA